MPVEAGHDQVMNLKVSGVIEIENTPPIVIPEEQPAAPTMPTVPSDASGLQVPNAIGELIYVPEACPTAMAYCLDEDAEDCCEELPMPHDKVDCGESCESDEDAEFWNDKEAVDAWIEAFQAELIQMAGEKAEDKSQCPHHYHHAPVCPYSGRSSNDMRCPEPSDNRYDTPKSPGSEDPSGVQARQEAEDHEGRRRRFGASGHRYDGIPRRRRPPRRVRQRASVRRIA